MREKSISVMLLLLIPLSVLASNPGQGGIWNFQKKSYVLSDAEFEKINAELKTRCNLVSSDSASFPWYYYYEVGLAMADKNDWQRALDHFLEALDRRHEPAKFGRTYGVWFIHYHPYYQIGRAHYHLKNWDCALHAFSLSERFESFTRNSSEPEKLKMMKASTLKEVRSKKPRVQ
jgi:tetratricopeptide (TPR) repeat protein